MFIRYAAFHLQQLSAKRQQNASEQKSIEANKDTTEEAKEATEAKDKREKSQEKETKKKDKKKADTKKEEAKTDKPKETKVEEKDEVKSDKKEEDLLLNENYSEIDTDVAKKIVESITDSICSGDKPESDCKYLKLPAYFSPTMISKVVAKGRAGYPPAHKVFR